MFTGNGRLVVRYEKNIVANMDNEFLHEGIPQRQLKAVISKQLSVVSEQLAVVDVKEKLLGLLSSPNIASKSSVIQIYDHEVQGGTMVQAIDWRRSRCAVGCGSHQTNWHKAASKGLVLSK